MLQIISDKSFNTPRLVCACCKELIDNAGRAAVVHRNWLKDGERTDVFIVHKNLDGKQCLAWAEEQVKSQGGDSGWNELRTFLAHLVANSGMTANDIAGVLERPDN